MGASLLPLLSPQVNLLGSNLLMLLNFRLFGSQDR